MIANPEPGPWTIRIGNATAVGQPVLSCFVGSPVPAIRLDSATVDSSQNAVSIIYDTANVQGPTQIDLYATTDPDGQGGTLVASVFTSSNGPAHLVWNPSGASPGTYYLYATMVANAGPVVTALLDYPLVLLAQSSAEIPASSGSTPFASPAAHGQTALVTALYRELLGRDPEPAGLRFWTHRLSLREAPCGSPNRSPDHPSTGCSSKPAAPPGSGRSSL